MLENKERIKEKKKNFYIHLSFINVIHNLKENKIYILLLYKKNLYVITIINTKKIYFNQRF